MKAILLLLLSGLCANAASVTLGWDANTETNLTGYKVYVGSAPGVYASSNVVTSTQTTLTNLSPATKYYFAVTAFSPDGESEFSEELSYTTPPAAPKRFRIITAMQGANSITGPWSNLWAYENRTIEIENTSAFLRCRLEILPDQ